jgi:putative glycosyltransferase
MKLSVVTTLYYSEGYVEEFYARVVAAVTKVTNEYEILFVNDGSPDLALQKVMDLQKTDKRIVAIDLARNFGHHRAIMTGLQYTEGDFIFLIDSDLEEEPELLSLYWDELNGDNQIDVVYGVQRRRKGGILERSIGHAWYLLFSFLSDIEYPANSLTARLMSRRYVDSVLKFSEKELELWGVFVLAGFNQKPMGVSKGSKGSSTYTLRRKIRMTANSITSFSSKPLVVSFFLGFIMTLVSLCFVIYLLVQRLIYAKIVEGWTSTLVSIWFIGGIIILSLGIIGVYLSKIFLEIKNRPLTVIRKIYRGESE